MSDLRHICTVVSGYISEIACIHGRLVYVGSFIIHCYVLFRAFRVLALTVYAEHVRSELYLVATWNGTHSSSDVRGTILTGILQCMSSL